MKVLVITTGGTIDKDYFDRLSEYRVGAPVVGRLLSQVRVAFEYEVISLFRKDSLDITAQDRREIRDLVASRSEALVLITHGTDGLVETALALESLRGKTIVLTGALKPAAFNVTDAQFNIGCAIGALQSAVTGTYVVMNGRVFSAAEVEKNHAAQMFQPTQ